MATSDKHQNMVEFNRAKSLKLEEKAIREIRKMKNMNEEIRIPVLVEKIGCSRAYLYNNEKVRREWECATEYQQKINLRKTKIEIFGKAKQKKLEMLELQNQELIKRVCELEKINEKLQRTADNYDISVIREMRKAGY